MVQYPFQKLCVIQPLDSQSPFLVAASGPHIFSFDLKTGSLLFQWPNDFIPDDEVDPSSTADERGERPSKRRKTENDASAISHENTDDSIEIISERQKGERRKAKVETSALPIISHLITTTDARAVVVLTADDKCVRVFNIEASGRLALQSQRSMPKRICAIDLTPDQKTIVLGDKFGDVYSLPLYPTEDWKPQRRQTLESEGSFVPSATELTVHTKGNLAALKQQQEQKTRQSRKEGPEFEYKVLLGHVSLLTDVAVAAVQDGLDRKQYILSADRDEHIRVSRGIPQTHIIENYCTGHLDFVTRLCIVPWKPELLIAGSGEPSLRVYDWRKGLLIDEELFSPDSLQKLVNLYPQGEEPRDPGQIAVSGLWAIHYNATTKSPASSASPPMILATFEGIPIIQSYLLSEAGKLLHHQDLTLAGNVLDIGIGPALWDIVVSIDTVHRPTSMRILRPEEVPISAAFESFSLFSNLSRDNGASETQTGAAGQQDLRWEPSSLAILLNEAASRIKRSEVPPDVPSRFKTIYSSLGEVLYGRENLRKKRGLAGQEEEDLLDEGTPEIPSQVA